MFERVRTIVLRVLRVPHDPTPPLGAPGSVRIFRAGTKYYQLRLLRWGLAQISAAVGIAITVVVLHGIFAGAREALAARDVSRPAATAAPTPPSVPADTTSSAPPAAPDPAPVKGKKRARALSSIKNADDAKHIAGGQLADRMPLWIINTLEVLKLLGVVLFVVQLPFSYAAVRLEYEQHWYIVTDRSLRIRSGLVAMLESTMSFANLQQVVVQQGPLQRLLGLADVRVQSAGGGGDHQPGKGRRESLHTGVFHGVDNAHEIRDLILERLKRFREAGLGDPEDLRAKAHPAATTPAPAPAATPETLAAAHELLAEARALRAALAG